MSTKNSAKSAKKTALPAEAGSLIANARNDITIPFYSGVLAHADDTLIARGGGKGLKIYDEIERDTMAGPVLQKRRKTLIARDWTLEPASDDARDIEAAQLIREIIQELPFDRICEDLLDATLKGYAVSEIVWYLDGNRIKPRKIVTHDQRRFVFDEEWLPRLLTFGGGQEGLALPERKFIVHRHGVKGNNPYGLGLGSRLFWPVLFKREGITFWLHFLEKFAAPTVIGKVPIGTLSEHQSQLLRTLKDIRSSSAVTVPIGSEVDFLEAGRSGTVTYENFLAYWDKQISICVTGETLTTDIGSSGSRAASETHADILELLVDSDSDLLSDTLKEQLFQWIIDYNLPGAKPPSISRDRDEDEEAAAGTKKSKAEAAKAHQEALEQVLEFAASLDDEAAARDYVMTSGLGDDLAETTIAAMLASKRVGSKKNF